MGGFTGNPDNDLITPEGTAIRIGGSAYNKGTSQMVYEQFGLKCEFKFLVPVLFPLLIWGMFSRENWRQDYFQVRSCFVPRHNEAYL